MLFQYATGLIALALLVYCAWRHRRRALWFLAGAVPPALALGAYDWAAFGSPFHLSYRYVANVYTERQHHGFFGIGVPTLGGLKDVLVGTRGLLYFSPVLVAAAVGLWLLWRRGTRAEALLAAVVVVLFLLLDAGYFLVYGGGTPGPRFFAPALPFLALGLPVRPRALAAPDARARFRLGRAHDRRRAQLGRAAVPTTRRGSRPATRSRRRSGPGSCPIATSARSLVLVCALAAVGVGAVAVVRR